VATAFSQPAHGLTILFSVAAVLLSLVLDESPERLALYVILAICVWGYVLHVEGKAERGMSAALHTVESWFWHGLTVLGYISVGGTLFGERYGPASSVCSGSRDDAVVSYLVGPLAIVLFIGAALKTALYDMADFSVVEKIVALMIVGSVLLGAAYGFQRSRDRVQVSAQHSLSLLRQFGSRGH
jgi:hypothetical protein